MYTKISSRKWLLAFINTCAPSASTTFPPNHRSVECISPRVPPIAEILHGKILHLAFFFIFIWMILSAARSVSSRPIRSVLSPSRSIRSVLSPSRPIGSSPFSSSRPLVDSLRSALPRSIRPVSAPFRPPTSFRHGRFAPFRFVSAEFSLRLGRRIRACKHSSGDRCCFSRKLDAG